VLELSALNLVTIENVKKCKRSLTDVILVELIEAGNSAVCSELHKLIITFRMRKNYLKSRSKLLCPFIRKMMQMMMMMIIIII
jgi:CRISPR/Cas system-associated protein Csm6